MPNYGTIILHRTGSEGPRHDLYGYDEWTVTRNGKSATLHTGFNVWMKRDGRKFAFPTFKDEVIVRGFEKVIGCDLETIQNAYYKARHICRHCVRLTPTKDADGYPGESLNICAICGHIKSTDFNPSAIE